MTVFKKAMDKLWKQLQGRGNYEKRNTILSYMSQLEYFEMKSTMCII